MNEGTVYKAIECLTIHVPAEYLHSTTSGVRDAIPMTQACNNRCFGASLFLIFIMILESSSLGIGLGIGIGIGKRS